MTPVAEDAKGTRLHCKKRKLCSRGHVHRKELVERHQKIHNGQSSLHFANTYARGGKQSKQFPMKCSRLVAKCMIETSELLGSGGIHL